MKKGYWVISYQDDSDVESIKAYSALAASAIGALGGKPLLLGHPAVTHEEGQCRRTVVVEFEDLQKAVKAYKSQTYQKAVAKLNAKIARDFRIVEGME